MRAYFGDDESRYEARSPVTYAAVSPLPVFLAIAEHENPLLDVYGAEGFHRIAAARGRAPRFLRLPRHNHLSIVHTSTPTKTRSAPRCGTSSKLSAAMAETLGPTPPPPDSRPGLQGEQVLLFGSANSADSDRAIECDEAPAVTDGEREQIEVGHLARTVDARRVGDALIK